MDFLVNKYDNRYYISTDLEKTGIELYIRSNGTIGPNMDIGNGKLGYFRRKCDAQYMLNAYESGQKYK